MADNTPSPVSVRQMLAAFGKALTSEELAGVLNVSVDSIQKRAKRGSIPCFHIGTSVRFCPKTICDWIAKQ